MGSADLSSDLGVSFLAPAPSVGSADANSSNRDEPAAQPSTRRRGGKLRTEGKNNEIEQQDSDGGQMSASPDEYLKSAAHTVDQDENSTSHEKPGNESRKGRADDAIAAIAPTHQLDRLV